VLMPSWRFVSRVDHERQQRAFWLERVWREEGHHVSRKEQSDEEKLQTDAWRWEEAVPT
jgi:hypothetical protein